MSLVYVMNTFIPKPKVNILNWVKFATYTQLSAKKNNYATRPSSLLSRIVTSFNHSQSIVLNRDLDNIYFSKSFSKSCALWSSSNTPNQNKEKMKNYIFSAVVGIIVLGVFITNALLETHQDYVYIEPEEKK